MSVGVLCSGLTACVTMVLYSGLAVWSGRSWISSRSTRRSTSTLTALLARRRVRSSTPSTHSSSAPASGSLPSPPSYSPSCIGRSSSYIRRWEFIIHTYYIGRSPPCIGRRISSCIGWSGASGFQFHPTCGGIFGQHFY